MDAASRVEAVKAREERSMGRTSELLDWHIWREGTSEEAVSVLLRFVSNPEPSIGDRCHVQTRLVTSPTQGGGTSQIIESHFEKEEQTNG